jgi:glyoxylase-like metal-dependent hydrolase (beta-lactamase superfamily II)
MNDWFHVMPLAEGVWQLTEPGHVATWLVCGDERAALIDTGCGFAPIRPVVESLTSLPVVVVQTHHHLDHIGGTTEFSEVLIHPLGVEPLATPVPDVVCQAYLRYAAEQVAAFEAYRVLDERFFHLLEDHHRVQPLPAAVRRGEWHLPPAVATGTIDDGDVVELGGRALAVLHTPGHSPDSVSLELVGERLLFGGDTVNTGPVYAQMPASDVGALHASLTRLAAAADRWDRVFCSHFMRTEVPPSYLGRQVDAFAALLRGEVPLRPTIDCVGTPVLEAMFDGFGVLVPEAWAPPVRDGAEVLA